MDARTMPTHHDIIPKLVDECASIHAGCGVVLIGSVARGTEIAGSDIDLNLIFLGNECPMGQHPYVAEDNRWQLVMKEVVEGFRIDVAWETEQALLERLQSDDVVNCWPFSHGRVLRDAKRVAARCLRIARAWFRNHPEIVARYEAVYAEAKQQQRRNRGA